MLLWCKQSASDSEILLLYLLVYECVGEPTRREDGYFKNYYEY